MSCDICDRCCDFNGKFLMSDSATFELETTKQEAIITRQISCLWHGFGYYVDVYSYPQYPHRVFCTLDYVYGHPDEEVMLRRVADYLLNIASNQKIYYYRCADFAPLSDDAFLTPEITVDDLFQDAFRPSIAASVTQKYLLQKTHISQRIG